MEELYRELSSHTTQDNIQFSEVDITDWSTNR